MNSFYQLSMAARLIGLFVVGSMVGGLINWSIYQLGLNLRAISPWSPQPADAPPRRLIDFVPIFGWLFLRRETPLWGPGYWIRPLVMELLAGGIFAGLYWWEVGQLGLYPANSLPSGVSPTDEVLHTLHLQFAAHIALFCLMLAATFIDIDDQIIPDGVTLPGTLLALTLAAAHPWALLPDRIELLGNGRQYVHFLTLASPAEWSPWFNGQWDRTPVVIGFACYLLWCFALLPRRWRGRRGAGVALNVMSARIARDPFSKLVLLIGLVGSVQIYLFWRLGPPHWEGLLSALVGMMVSAGIVWVVRLVGALVLRREAMGFGDVTLMAMIGAVLGWQAGVVVFFAAPFFAIVYALFRLVFRGEREIPYGPFLCAAAAAVVVGWSRLWQVMREFLLIYGDTLGRSWWFLPAMLLAAVVLLAVLLGIVQWLKASFRPKTAQPGPPSAA